MLPTASPTTMRGPSVGTIIAGVLGIASAVGVGYLLGANNRDEQEETDRRLRQQTLAERRRQQQLQQQQLANHSYYPAQFGTRQQQQHTEIKEATDHSTPAIPQPIPVKSSLPSPAHPYQPSSASSSSDPSIVVSAPLPASASAPLVGDTGARDQLEDATLCKICYDAPLDAVLFPCRHQCCCYGCSQQLNECPVCRAPFTSSVKIYRS